MPDSSSIAPHQWLLPHSTTFELRDEDLFAVEQVELVTVQ